MHLSQPLLCNCQPYLHAVNCFTNDLVTKSRWYYCSTDTQEMLYQLVYPEVINGGSPTIAIVSFWPATVWKDF